MSMSETDITHEVEEYLESFPLGKTEEEILEAFTDLDEAEVDEALDELEEDGTVLKARNKYRWTG